MAEENSANAPIKKFRVGQVVATIWKNDRKEGQDYDTFSTTVEKSYKKGDEWKTTSSFNVNDLPKVELATAKAFEYIATKAYEVTE